MNKALLISAAVALAVSGSVFAKGSSHRSSANSDMSASTQQFTEADCNTLTVDSARAACMRSIGGSSMGMGATSGSGEGMTAGKGHGKRMHKRSKNRAPSDAAAAQHQTDKANGNH
jgi:hypothetical protein